MNGVNFFGTTAFPGQPCSNKKFNRTVQIVLATILALGVVLASLGAAGILPYSFVVIGSTIAAITLVTLIVYKVLQKNWLLEALRKAMQDNNPDNFQAVINQCDSQEITRGWDLCGANAPVIRISSRELVGTLQDTEVSEPINEFIARNLNTIQNGARWDEVFNNIPQMNANEQYAPDIHRFANRRQETVN